MTVSFSSFSYNSSLDSAMAALRRDLLANSLSTMRNYHFAILPYDSKEEFKLRSQVRALSDELKGQGWNILSISLQQLLVNRLKNEEPRVIESIIRTEHRLYKRNPERALNHLKGKIASYVEGVDGIAQDVIALVEEFAASSDRFLNGSLMGETPKTAPVRSLIFIGRAGALYPFFRSSALLKHIDGRTHNIPMILLYPGERKDISALSFMGEVSTDRDYRPRIY